MRVHEVYGNVLDDAVPIVPGSAVSGIVDHDN